MERRILSLSEGNEVYRKVRRLMVMTLGALSNGGYRRAPRVIASVFLALRAGRLSLLDNINNLAQMAVVVGEARDEAG